MTEQFILSYLPGRIEKLGYKRYHTRYRDLTIQAGETLEFSAYNELWMIVDDPPGLVVESGYGLYDTTGAYLEDNTHEHRGNIVITNPESDNKRIKFIQVIIIN